MNSCKNVKVGIVGYGNFGKLIEKQLQKYFILKIYDPYIQDNEKKSVSLDELRSCDYIILSLTMDSFEKAVESISKIVSSTVTVIDVCSVKIKPIEILHKYLDGICEFIGTHPLFGPQTAQNGIENKKIALIPSESKKYLSVKKFLESKLKLKIIECTADEHDKEMAYVQALSHMIGHVLTKMNLTDLPLSTATYSHILKAKDIVSNDSKALFETIMQHNKYAKDAVETFVKSVNEIHNNKS